MGDVNKIPMNDLSNIFSADSSLEIVIDICAFSREGDDLRNTLDNIKIIQLLLQAHEESIPCRVILPKGIPVQQAKGIIEQAILDYNDAQIGMGGTPVKPEIIFPAITESSDNQQESLSLLTTVLIVNDSDTNLGTFAQHKSALGEVETKIIQVGALKPDDPLGFVKKFIAHDGQSIETDEQRLMKRLSADKQARQEAIRDKAVADDIVEQLSNQEPIKEFLKGGSFEVKAGNGKKISREACLLSVYFTNLIRLQHIDHECITRGQYGLIPEQKEQVINILEENKKLEEAIRSCKGGQAALDATHRIIEPAY